MIKLNKKNLIISTVGDNSLHRRWLSNSASYDVALIYYGDSVGYEGESKYYYKSKGFKYHLIKDFLENNPILYSYDYVWLPDDDIQADPEDIEKLFRMMADYDLWVAQPSIIGYYGVKITLHQLGSLIRFTNWVEIMCPCFNSKALKICQKVFKENETGWSIETIWNELIGHPKDKIAIIDDIVVVHTRPVGGNYRLEKALKEANEVYYKWKLDKEMEKDIEYGSQTGGDIYCSVIYKQFFKEMEDGIEKSERCWPNPSLINFKD